METQASYSYSPFVDCAWISEMQHSFQSLTMNDFTSFFVPVDDAFMLFLRKMEWNLLPNDDDVEKGHNNSTQDRDHLEINTGVFNLSKDHLERLQHIYIQLKKLIKSKWSVYTPLKRLMESKCSVYTQLKRLMNGKWSIYTPLKRLMKSKCSVYTQLKRFMKSKCSVYLPYNGYITSKRRNSMPENACVNNDTSPVRNNGFLVAHDSSLLLKASEYDWFKRVFTFYI